MRHRRLVSAEGYGKRLLVCLRRREGAEAERVRLALLIVDRRRDEPVVGVVLLTVRIHSQSVVDVVSPCVVVLILVENREVVVHIGSRLERSVVRHVERCAYHDVVRHSRFALGFSSPRRHLIYIASHIAGVVFFEAALLLLFRHGDFSRIAHHGIR